MFLFLFNESCFSKRMMSTLQLKEVPINACNFVWHLLYMTCACSFWFKSRSYCELDVFTYIIVNKTLSLLKQLVLSYFFDQDSSNMSVPCGSSL